VYILFVYCRPSYTHIYIYIHTTYGCNNIEFAKFFDFTSRENLIEKIYLEYSTLCVYIYICVCICARVRTYARYYSTSEKLGKPFYCYKLFPRCTLYIYIYVTRGRTTFAETSDDGLYYYYYSYVCIYL